MTPLLIHLQRLHNQGLHLKNQLLHVATILILAKQRTHHVFDSAWFC
jgi:hypothetical protein